MKGREGITRVSVDLTTAQRAALDEMIRRKEAAASEAAGMAIQIGTRQFFHTLLKQEAAAMDVEWPEDYPSPGGWRGGGENAES